MCVLLTSDLASGGETPAPGVRMWTIHYRAHNGDRRSAYVLVPSWYGPKNHPRIPLIISPHGRGLTGRTNAAIWGSLPGKGSFAVVNPDGQGRLLPQYSWGSRGQIEDLARMPTIVELTLPWLKIDRDQVYAFGGSMGGQESLLLAARHPKLLAGAAVFDSVTDLARQYNAFPRLQCDRRCRHIWSGPLGLSLQNLARREIGGSPWRVPRAYALRSPLTYARALASSCLPLQVWWSDADRIVLGQQQQSGRLFREIKRLNPNAPVQAFVGLWRHSAEMTAGSRLPLALETFGLLTPGTAAPAYALHHEAPPATSALCTRR
jgi:pimeloyl-ACP methyl ester carboxylesterase